MKQEILDRIVQLGGNIENVNHTSLKEDLEAISFSTVLYPKQKDTPWAKSDQLEPINGITKIIDENRSLIESNITSFYDKIIAHFYRDTDESFGQVFYKKHLFTPFKEGSDDFKEWNGEWEEDSFKEVIIGNEMEFMIIGYSYGSPDNYFVCLTDPNQENPIVYGTDHEVYFDEITKECTLEEYFNSFITPQELIDTLKYKLGV
ncbi:MAG: hypothetical protein MI922_06675 [Bacteroidales bacterium]|nr:hypothetical protein [Bacteroidales bacterium]